MGKIAHSDEGEGVMNRKRIKIALVGLGFGAEFAAIYRDHPDVEEVAICDTNPTLLQAYGDKYGFERRYTDIHNILESDEYDAVHLVTPIHSHGKLSVAVMKSGKHCACTVPMATTLEELKEIVAVQKMTGKQYMMMETSVYTYPFLKAKEMLGNGDFGRIQFLRGAHYQDMEGWPEYWKGLPPMHYATHAIAPLLALSGSRAVKVHCFGSGVMRSELTEPYHNPYPIETAIFQLETPQLSAEVTRSLFHTARDYMESFNIYGEKSSMEWHMEKEAPVVFQFEDGYRKNGRGHRVSHRPLDLPDFTELLPESISHYSKPQPTVHESNPHLSVLQGGNHHGSHPHLVHEFVRSIVEDRKPWIDAVTAAHWTAAGICAHESAMLGGTAVEIPCFE